LSLYSGKVVCNRCALFQERPLDWFFPPPKP
jgi:hypothetical protein